MQGWGEQVPKSEIQLLKWQRVESLWATVQADCILCCSPKGQANWHRWLHKNTETTGCPCCSHYPNCPSCFWATARVQGRGWNYCGWGPWRTSGYDYWWYRRWPLRRWWRPKFGHRITRCTRTACGRRTGIIGWWNIIGGSWPRHRRPYWGSVKSTKNLIRVTSTEKDETPTKKWQT